MHKHNRLSRAGPLLEVASIFQRYKPLLGVLPTSLGDVVDKITTCRTARLGGHIRKCDSCNYQEQSYNSCRNRHCPKCQFLPRAQWVKNREDELLPIQYFHVVFTLPHVLNPLIYANKKELFSLFFQKAGETLKEVGARRLGVEIGFISVLHTWGQNLSFHPHIHMIVAGGGLSLKNKNKWKHCKKKYLFPTKILSLVFRGKFLSELEKLHKTLIYPEKIKYLSNTKEFKNLLIESAKKPWIVYTKRPFAGPKQVIGYLGNYTHRIAISNHRLIKIQDGHIYFKYRDYKTNENKVMALHAKDFMKRFLLHVLPKKFVRIRHYGFLSNRERSEKIKTCKNLFGLQPITQKQYKNWKEKLLALLGIDLIHCPQCKKGIIKEYPLAQYQDTS